MISYEEFQRRLRLFQSVVQRVADLIDSHDELSTAARDGLKEFARDDVAIQMKNGERDPDIMIEKVQRKLSQHFAASSLAVQNQADKRVFSRPH